jgi:hypothetical protein
LKQTLFFKSIIFKMAQQKGIIPLKGTIGNITFYKSKDGFLAREKGGVDGKRISNDPAFQRTRENGFEFGRACSAGKLLRNALRIALQNVSSRNMVGRLTREMMRVIQADVTNSRGQRNVIDGEAELLTGFEFNENAKLAATLFASYTASIDRVTGVLQIDIPSFIPANLVTAPSGTTHFKIVSAGTEINFEGKSYTVDNTETAVLPWDTTPTAAINLAAQAPPASTHPLFLALGIEFYQHVNGTMYPLKNGSYNALALVAVNGV